MLKQVWLYKSIAVLHLKNWIVCYRTVSNYTGADPGFQVKGCALKKIAPSGGRHEIFWGISCGKIIFFSNFRGGGAPPSSAPAIYAGKNDSLRYCILYSASIKCCDIFIYIYFWKHLFIYITYRVCLLCCIYCSTIFDKNLKIQNLLFFLFLMLNIFQSLLFLY